MDAKDILKSVRTVLVIDWPDREVPELLALAGFEVIVRGGPGPQDYGAYKVADGKVVAERIGRAPDHADLVYSYRPLRELPEILSMAKKLGAQIVWTQSGVSPSGARDSRGCWVAEEELRGARSTIESAGMQHVSAPYIGDVLRDLRSVA